VHLITLHNKIISDALRIHEVVEKVFPRKMPERYVEQSLYLAPFLARLNAVTVPLKVLNVLMNDATIVSHDVLLSAIWYPKSPTTITRRSSDIHLQWHVHPREHRCHITPTIWRRQRFYFWTFLQHELAHRHQSADRDEDTASLQFAPVTDNAAMRKQQAYLGDFDEVEAWAHDIALEMVIWFPTLNCREAYTEMRNFHRTRVTATYPIYAGVFSETPTHPAMQALHKKIRAWYRIMDQHRDTYKTLGLEPL